MTTSIPIVDLERIACTENTSSSDWEDVAIEIRNSLHDVGFMYLINHGVPQDVIADNFKISENFFTLPREAKMKYKKNLKKSRNGWVEPGEELLHPDSKFEYRECFDIIRRKPIYPNDDILTFESTNTKLQFHCQKLIRNLLKLLALSLKIDDHEYFVKCCHHLDNPETDNECDFSMIHYPPIHSDTVLPPNTIRCAEHTDYEILTLLFQNEIGGLEIKITDGNWIAADPIPNSILVNTGDLLEVWTNKFYPATLHRVVIPKTAEERQKSRYSFAYFIAPDNGTMIQPLESEVIPHDATCTTSEKTFTAYEHIMDRVNTAYGVKVNK
ncbi:hypothetical protein HA402_013765 [Bradysia odoriphaga]|nr:hypothetical protein HA402_013765 [Bradysia odoriphaga]